MAEDFTAKAGIPLLVTVACSSYLQAAQLAESGLCATILPDLALAVLGEGRFHRVPFPHRYRLCIAYTARSADNRPALARLIGELGDAMAIESNG